MTDITRRLAAFVADHPGGISSAAATESVKRALLDLLGVAALGASEPAGQIALRYAETQARSGSAAVIGGKTRLAPSLAALVNGTAGHALDYDDIGLGAGHISVAILPSVLAVAEDVEANGESFSDALILGYEVAHRLTRMYDDTRLGPYAAGYHKPSVYAVFGATAAVSRLLGLDTDATVNAFGIAASQAGGLRINFGTMTKPLHAGLSNRTAIEASLLASEGFTAHPEALEGRFGWHYVICRGEGDLSVTVEDLGPPYAIEEGLWFKNYPCCGANHYAIDGVLRLMEEHKLAPEDVEGVHVAIEARNLNEVLVYEWPNTPLEGKFCLAYNVAAAMTDKAVTVDTFTEESLDRLQSARDRVRVEARSDLPQNGAEITVRTRDGQQLHRTQLVLRGSLADPMSWDELVVKFMANTSRLATHAKMDAVVDAVWALDRSSSLRDITEPLLGAT